MGIKWLPTQSVCCLGGQPVALLFGFKGRLRSRLFWTFPMLRQSQIFPWHVCPLPFFPFAQLAPPHAWQLLGPFWQAAFLAWHAFAVKSGLFLVSTEVTVRRMAS